MPSLHSQDLSNQRLLGPLISVHSEPSAQLGIRRTQMRRLLFSPRSRRKARELEHLGQWRMHVNVKTIEHNTVTLRFSSDGGSLKEVILSPFDTPKHIDGNAIIRLELESPDEPAQLKVTMNDQNWPMTTWKQREETFRTIYTTQIFLCKAGAKPTWRGTCD